MNAVNNWHDHVINATPLAFEFELSEPDLEINCPRLVATATTDGDDEGVMTDEVTFDCSRVSGNDEFIFKLKGA